ncbi:MAG: hypothetical protein Tsb0015_08380 [Simkaniaceae bacterium]
MRARLGNQLEVFFKAYHLARKYNAKLVYVPIDVDFSEALAKKVKLVSKKDIPPKHIPINNPQILTRMANRKNYRWPLVYDVGFDCSEYKISDKNDIYIKEEIKELLFSCLESSLFPEISKDCLNVGIHVRYGDGYDHPLGSQPFYNGQILKEQSQQLPLEKRLEKGEYYLDIFRPLKAPPMQYYVDAIRILEKLLPQEKKYFLFTDHPEKEFIADLLNSHLEKEIDFQYIDYPEDKNTEDLLDLLTLSSMNVLIRPGQSTFSLAAEFFTNFSYVIYPNKYQWIGNCLVMKNIEILHNGKKHSEHKMYCNIE